ncbi:MAG TPA: DUF302 domain-containing protein [Gammaproteobacteria bacterium]|nr:DUF302 domain-containing protein [Gammaproteobacteria bacterium]
MQTAKQLLFMPLLFIAGMLFSMPAMSQVPPASPVFQLTVDKPIDEVYDSVYKSLEDARFYVVFEPNIGANLSRFSGKWGDDYNQNNLTAIRSMVFCNGWYANKVSNLDPSMLGFCPLHISLIERDGKTTALFNRPTVLAKGSPALDLFVTIENEVIAAIKAGMD